MNGFYRMEVKVISKTENDRTEPLGKTALNLPVHISQHRK